MYIILGLRYVMFLVNLTQHENFRDSLMNVVESSTWLGRHGFLPSGLVEGTKKILCTHTHWYPTAYEAHEVFVSHGFAQIGRLF